MRSAVKVFGGVLVLGGIAAGDVGHRQNPCPKALPCFGLGILTNETNLQQAGIKT